MGNYDFNDNHQWEGQELQNGDFDREEPIYVEESVYREFSSDEESVPRNQIICTILLIAANVIIYLKCTGIENYSATGGANYRDIVEGGEYGRLLSSMFLHADFTHLYCNMIALFLFGRVVEEELGSFKMFLIYFLAGIGSGLFSVYLHHMVDPEGWTNSIGASGAVYALMVSSVFVSIKNISGSRVKAVLSLGFYILIIAGDIAVNQTEGVDFFAHLAGAVIGAVIALLIFCFQRERKAENFVMKVLGIGLTLCFSLVAVKEADLGGVPSWNAERIQFIQVEHLDGMPYISLGEALDDFCNETEWNAFVSENQREIVDFKGNCKYQNRQEDVHIQFILDMDEDSYQISYFALNEKPQTQEEMEDFFDEAFSAYGKGHGITMNWQ